MKHLTILGPVIAFLAGLVGSPAAAEPQSGGGHSADARHAAVLQEIFHDVAIQDRMAFDAIAGAPYVQHSPNYPDGWAVVWTDFSHRPPGFQTKIYKVFGEGNFLVMVRSVVRDAATPEAQIVDLLRFASDGKYMEHWDFSAPLSTLDRDGLPALQASSAKDGHRDESEDEADKEVALRVLRAVHVDGDSGVVSSLVSADLKEHSEAAPLRPAAAAAMPDSFAPRYIVADNGLVVVISDSTAQGKRNAVVDLLKIASGRVTEHWNVTQRVPDRMPHRNGIF